MLLAGANNTGKTALLSALDLVVRGATPPLARHAAASEPARVRARFVLSEAERTRLLSNVNDARISDGGAFSWLELIYAEPEPGDGMQPAELTAAWPGRPAVQLGRSILADGTQRVEINNRVLAVVGGTSPNELVTGGGSDLLGSLDLAATGTGDVLSVLSSRLRPISEFIASWRERYYHFNALRQGTDWTHSLVSTPDLVPSGGNLPAVLVDLQHNRPDMWERVRELIERIVPDIGHLETRTSGNQVEVVFGDRQVPGYRPNLKGLGTGVEQLLMTIVVGVTQPAPSIVVIEEPETNLHAGAQRALLAQLREWASDRLFVLSTHSSVFLNRAAGTSSVFLVERAQGASTVRELTGGPSEALTALGVQLSDVLSADRLLVVEGDSDREILTVWFPDLLGNPRVEVAIGRGGDNARFAGIARDLLQAVDRQKSRRLLYLRDRDELSSTALDHLEADPAVYVLQRRELENYLLQDASAIAAALVDRGVVDADEVNSGRVQEVLREGADRLKPTIVLKRIAGELASRRLVDRKLVAELIQQGPSLDRFHAAIADRLPSEGLLDDLTKEWVAAEEDLAATWEERWQELAPGSDVLAYLWRTYGRSYDKLQDGLATARRMQAPTELTDILHRFLTD